MSIDGKLLLRSSINGYSIGCERACGGQWKRVRMSGGMRGRGPDTPSYSIDGPFI